MKVMDVAEAKEGRLMELDIRNAGMSQETVDDFKDMDRTPKEKRGTPSATLKDQDSRRGSKWSVMTGLTIASHVVVSVCLLWIWF